MCNHYRNNPDIQATLQTWREYIAWSLDPVPGSLASVDTDVWPKRFALVVRNSDDGARLDVMRWGVAIRLPGKRPGTTVTKQITNLRNLASPFWRSILNDPNSRCLVPFSQFAEPWSNSPSREIWFDVRSMPVAAFAGVWRPSDIGGIFAFLTCAPNPLVVPFHPKVMPVILDPEDYAGWLRGKDAATLAVPFPSQLMTTHTGLENGPIE